MSIVKENLKKGIEYFGIAVMVEELGLSKVIEEVGPTKVIAEIGISKIIEEVGLPKVIEVIISSMKKLTRKEKDLLLSLVDD